MKFAKEIEQGLVPEWRVKYLDYKQGKKKVKAVAKALRTMNTTPRTPLTRRQQPQSRYGATSPTARRTQTPAARRYDGAADDPIDSLSGTPAPIAVDSREGSDESDNSTIKAGNAHSVPIPVAKKAAADSGILSGNYGSFVPTPPAHSKTFELPGPAVHPQSSLNADRPAVSPQLSTSRRNVHMSTPNPYEVGATTSPPPRSNTFASIRNKISPKQDFRRIFSMSTPLTPGDGTRFDVDMTVYDQVRERQREFFSWMDKELDKIETFYRSKEDEAGVRLEILRDQLHQMRNRRIEELAHEQHTKALRKQDERATLDFNGSHPMPRPKSDGLEENKRPNSRDHLHAWFDPIERVIDRTKATIRGPPGRNSKALQNMHASPAMMGQQGQEGHQDYERRPHEHDVPYRTAKRKLKLALQEFHRGMELLKSYALLNRTAFRKINKKYDKAVDAHPPLRYMSEKVNKAYFVKSVILDGHLHAVEDLYARYFERGNHKIAVGKLRTTFGKQTDQSASAFRNGMLIGIGAVFAIQGVINGADILHYDPDPNIRTQTGYLLQIYGGYFLVLYLFSWFCLDCCIWTRNKINYAFVFEFDPRHNLDWRQLSEFPSFLILLLGLFVWINFSRYGTPAMYIYYPVILVFVTLLIIFFPAPYIFHRSRRWFVYSNWRLLMAGLYPVEFRDFFLGDMYCSLTYAISNVELFFCLYAHRWNDPSQCNSSHSRLLGFFSTLPGIWRALQCVRRYYDTRNVFPHLVNCGKYTMTILYYITLSLYRIDKSNKMLALFTTFAAVNALYCSIWDLVMDWSLLQPNAKRPLLRDVRGYKSPYWYYLAMIIDPILRFNWIFYSIYTGDLQHSSIVSFLVGLSEVSRRGMWVLFRVENEHCSNVARFKASRDVPLPYEVDESSQESLTQHQEATAGGEVSHSSPAMSRHRSHTSGALEAQDSAGSNIRRRPQPSRAGTFTAEGFTKILANAHTQDFEKKRKPGAGDSDNISNRRKDGDMSDDARDHSSDDDEEEDDQDQQDLVEANYLLRERSRNQ